MEHPIYSVRESLVPGALVSVKVFKAQTEDSLEQEISSWVSKTQNLIVCPGPVYYDNGQKKVTMALTYVSSGKDNEKRQQRSLGAAPSVTTRPVKKLSAFGSGGRFTR